MGLDMYAHSMPKDDNRPPVDFDVEGLHLDNTPRIHYWRKHPNLHGWMAGRYYEKGGTDDDFNVNRLPDTSGFFFGATTGEERDDDLEFIRKCREEFAKGRTIAYYAWW